MLENKDYCDYETSVALKKLGCSYLSNDKVYVGKGGLYCKCNPPYDSQKYNEGELLSQFYSLGCYKKVGTTIPAITLYDAQKWLREEKEVYVTVIPEYNEFGPIKGVKYRLEVVHWKDDEFGYETIEWLDEECPHTIITFDSYEEALSEGIKEAVKILKG